ncbi:MAG: methyltransferase [Gammaproteobacteria bacterium]|nr:methyltransferase [Gammaproteobacteria bacterium]
MIKELYRVEDELGPVLVLEKGDKRILSFDSRLQQSSVYMNKPFYLAHEYTQIMILGMLFVDAKNVTILGLGGGSLGHYFNHYYPHVLTRIVELRQSVIDVAYQWFNLPQKANLKVICKDANVYIKQAKEQSIDLLLSDLYIAEGMSEIQAHTGFIKSCHQALSENGWLVINLHDLPGDDSEIMQSIRNTFADLYMCEVYSGNWILFCGKTEVEYTDHELNERARALDKNVEMQLMYYYKQLRNIYSV